LKDFKILIVNTTDQGGAANACIRLHLGLLKEGYDSKLLVLYKSRNIPEVYEYDKDDKSFSTLQRLKKKHQLKSFNKCLATLERGVGIYSPPMSLYNIRDHELYDWADIINLHWVSNFIDIPTFFDNNTKPVVWTLHDMYPFTSGYHYTVGFPIHHFDSLNEKYLKIKKKALAKNIAPIVITAPSKWLAEISKKSDLFSSFEHRAIPNSINENEFKPYHKEEAKKMLNLSLDEKIILFVADKVKSKRKGLSILLESLTHIKEELTIMVLGDTTHIDINSAHVKKLGFISNEKELAVIYSAADLYVIPSMEDNLPNTVLESIFCGTPVVGFKTGGIPEMINHKKNGYLCQNTNPKELAEGISEALRIEFDQNEISKAAVTKFGTNVQVRNFALLFKNILNNKS
jgi:glycosyltransferase involved in cell wall biosynthesis